MLLGPPPDPSALYHKNATSETEKGFRVSSCRQRCPPRVPGGLRQRSQSKPSSRLAAASAGWSPRPGGLEIPAGRGPAVVNGAVHVPARHAAKRHAAAVGPPSHGPAEGVDPHGQACGHSSGRCVVRLGPVEGGPVDDAAGPAVQAGVVRRATRRAPLRIVTPAGHCPDPLSPRR